MSSVQNAECRKCSVENAKSRKYGMYKTEGMTPLFPVLIRERPIAASATSHSNE